MRGDARGVRDDGDIDISSIPPGDVNFTVTLNADATGAGYSFPSDPYQAIALVVIPPGVSGNSLMFADQDEYADVYEYPIGLNGPNGRVVLDPTIKNSGVPPVLEPEPVPQ